MSGSTPSQSAEPPRALVERVQARVTEVGRTLDQRASRASLKSRRRQRAVASSHAAPQSPEAAQEIRSLRRVFRELGDAHREHRLRTGQHGSPALRDAAIAFKQAPSLTSLAVVAGLLDEIGILGW
jgi:phage host-nuclease inhibitor protein Gam